MLYKYFNCTINSEYDVKINHNTLILALTERRGVAPAPTRVVQQQRTRSVSPPPVGKDLKK